MKKLFVIMVLVLSFCTAVVFSEMGCYGGSYKHIKQERDIENAPEYLHFKDELNLTDKQVAELKKIRTDYDKVKIKKRADIKVARIELKEIYDQPKPDFQAARDKIKQISDIQLDLKLETLNAFEKRYGILNDNQRAKLPSLMEKLIEKKKKYYMQKRMDKKMKKGKHKKDKWD